MSSGSFLLTRVVDECERRMLPQPARMLLVVLARMADNGSGESHPGKECLARKTGATVRTNYNAMQRLIAEGLVQRTRNGKSWLYRVCLQAQTSAPVADKTSESPSDKPVSSESLADLEAMSSALDSAMSSAPVADEAKTSESAAEGYRNLVPKISAPDSDRTTKRTTKRELRAGAPRDAARSLPDGAPVAALPAKADPPPPVATTSNGAAPPDPKAVQVEIDRVMREARRKDPFDEADSFDAFLDDLRQKRPAALAIIRPKAIYAAPEVLRVHRERLMAL